MIDFSDLARRLKGKCVKDDALMPRAYQFSNPQGRPYHNDWGLWPFTRITRMSTTYMLPLPFKLLQAWGPVAPRWMPWQENYPGGLAPEAQTRATILGAGSEAEARGCPRELLAYDPVLPAGQAGLFGVWLDGAYRPCFYTESKVIFGRRLHRNYWLKPDLTLGDFATNFPDASLTWTSIK